MTNQDRAQLAEVGLKAFGKKIGIDLNFDMAEHAATEFMSCLMHYCDQQGLNLAEITDRARMLYQGEISREMSTPGITVQED